MTFSNAFSWMIISHDCPSSNIPESVLIEIIAWGRTGNKPLPEEMMTKFSDIGVIRHQCVKLAVKIISHYKHSLTGRHNKTLCYSRDMPTMSLVVQPWASCQIRKIVGAHAPGMPGTFSPSPQVSDPDMHHGTCVTHVPWCMPGSLTSSFLWNRRRGKTFPAFPAHAQPAILRIW